MSVRQEAMEDNQQLDWSEVVGGLRWSDLRKISQRGTMQAYSELWGMTQSDFSASYNGNIISEKCQTGLSHVYTIIVPYALASYQMKLYALSPPH